MPGNLHACGAEEEDCEAIEAIALTQPRKRNAGEPAADREACEAGVLGTPATDAALNVSPRQEGEVTEEVCEVEARGATTTDAASVAGDGQKVDEEDCEAGELALPAPDAASNTSSGSGSRKEGSRLGAGSTDSQGCGTEGGAHGHSQTKLEAATANAANSGSTSASDLRGTGGGFTPDGDFGSAKVRLFKVSGKTRPCLRCNGPCGQSCVAPAGQNAEEQEEAADVLLRVAKKLKCEAAASSCQATPSTSDSQGKKRAAPLLESTDGRKKRKTTPPLPSNFGAVPTWLKARPKVGGVQLDASHIPHLAWHRGITWCWACGAFALEVPNLLRNECKAPSVAGARQRVRLRLGLTPRNSVAWPVDDWAPQADRL